MHSACVACQTSQRPYPPVPFISSVKSSSSLRPASSAERFCVVTRLASHGVLLLQLNSGSASATGQDVAPPAAVGMVWCASCWVR